jgi:cysteine-rich repeat protein
MEVIVNRTVMWSPVLLAVALSPAFLQSDCSPKTGDPNVVSLEIEGGGLDRIVQFDNAVLAYNIWLDGATMITIRGQTVAPDTRLSWDTGAEYGTVGIGTGETTITAPADGTTLYVTSTASGGASKAFAFAVNPSCSPGDCDDANPCTSDQCDVAISTCTFVAEADGTPCDFQAVGDGICISGMCGLASSGCGDGVVELPEECDDGNATNGDGCASDCTVEPISKTIPMVCRNNVDSTVREASYELTLDPLGPVAAGASFDAELSGKAVIPEFFLDAVQGVMAGGVTQIDITDLNATVSVRSGAIGPDVLLTAANGPTSIPIIDGSGDACAACNAINATKADQCLQNGFCVAGDLEVPLLPAMGTFTADLLGDVLIGWYEDLPLPTTVNVFSDPVGSNGVRWDLSGVLFIGFECSMGTANTAGTMGVALPDEDLITLSIVTPVTTCGDGLVELPEECDDGNTIDGDGCASDCTIEPITKTVPMACADNAFSELRTEFYELTVDPLGPIFANSSFEVQLGGQAVIPEFFLDAAQTAFVGGATEVEIGALHATASVRDGATGAEVLLSRAQPFADGRCFLDTSPTPFSCTEDADCGPGYTCYEVAQIPTIDGTADACAACNAINATKAQQCTWNGFCVAGDLQLPLDPETAVFLADAYGSVLFGWHEDLSLSSPALFSDPAGPNGVRWVAQSGLFIGQECSMGTADAGGTAVVALPNQELLALPIITPPTTCGDGTIELPEECDDGNTTDGDGCASDCTIEPAPATLAMACATNVTTEYYPAEFQLTVDPLEPPVTTGFDAGVSGYADFDFWLSFLMANVTGPVSRVAVRGDLLVGVRGQLERTAIRASASNTCLFDSNGNTGVGAGPYPSCDPVNDVGSPNLYHFFANTDCVGLGGPTTQDPCLPFLDLEVVDGTGDACAACAALDPPGQDFKQTQCQLNGWCALIDPIPLTAEVGTFTFEGTEALFGFFPDVSVPPGSVQFGDGLDIFLGNIFSTPQVCYMGEIDPGNTSFTPLPDSALLSIPAAN